MTHARVNETDPKPPRGNPALGVLSRRLLILILTCSASFTLVATAVQLYLTYLQDVEELSESLSLIETSYVPALSRSLYELNDVQIDLQMRGALQLTDIVFLQISEDIAGERRLRAGPDRAQGDPPLHHAVQGSRGPRRRMFMGSTFTSVR